MSTKALWHLASHKKNTPFFIGLENGWYFLAKLTMKWQVYANRPCRPWSSLMFLGGCISWIAFTLSGSRWKLLDVTTNPRNFTLETPWKDFIDSFLTDEPSSSQILSLSILCGLLCFGVWPRYYQCNILQPFVNDLIKLQPWPANTWLQHSLGERASSCSSIPPWCLEGCMLFISCTYFDLVISRKAINEGHPFKTAYHIDYNIGNWEWKVVFWTSIVQISEVYANPHFSIFHYNGYDVSQPVGVLFFVDESTSF